MPDTELTSTIEQGVCTLTINRPEKLNALNENVLGLLSQAIDTLASDDSVNVVVITGAGERAFVAGADIGELRALEAQQTRAFIHRGQDLMNRIENLGKPVIAAVNGFALGGGCELALACTLRIAADSAIIGLPEVKLGLIPGYGGTQRLSRLIGRGRALHLMLTGEPVPADQAETMGLVNRVVPAGDLQETVEKLASRLAAGAPCAMKSIMNAVHQGSDLTLIEGLKVEANEFYEVSQTQDMREGTNAFLEKRKPQFQGK